MKNIILILGILLLSSAIAREDFSSSFPMATGLNAQIMPSDPELINVDNMKKKDKVSKARDEVSRNTAPKIKFDTRELNHQRALDYTTKQSNTMLPLF